MITPEEWKEISRVAQLAADAAKAATDEVLNASGLSDRSKIAAEMANVLIEYGTLDDAARDCGPQYVMLLSYVRAMVDAADTLQKEVENAGPKH